ncbi:DUF4190 domain-containing protein [Agrococcus sp. ARC_14]|uniref:DUF4190 domain-containing protein n=1 Tax=Agrococcus sp. ARC_14 TaxID=2919927 RepID=UPI001F05B7F1|nr:DUF4190 domain-containing protein [Agrococcus sp. ARC_14]MCH1884228.1 DUF4190 domain-containing protein [Agrococcus sp. ARC_14]
MSATAWPQQGWSAQPPAGPPAPPQPQVWSVPTHPGPKTNLLAILAIAAAAAGSTVFLGLGSIAAIVLGAIALAQMKRTGDDGRLLAIWSIVLGAITLVALIAATVLGVATMVAFVQQMPELQVP